jgi:uncharacterized membrane protein YfcA
MAVALGFIIAVAIGLTGVGAGSLTTPLLILVLGVPAQAAVGTALIFGAVVKLLTAPVYMARKQVSGRALAFLLAGGLPGVLIGALLLHGIRTSLVMTLIGFTIMTVAGFNLFRPSSPKRGDHTKWLALVAFPIGAETGFSSAGAGALGAVALLSLAPLSAAAVVGTDLCFGLALSSVAGGIHAALGSLDTGVLAKLLAGGVPGGVTGAMLASRIPSRRLRFALSLAMAVLGAQICWKGVTAL